MKLNDFCGPAFDVPDGIHKILVELRFMGNQENCALVFLDGPLEFLLGFDIQMVGRLVEHQKVYRLLHDFAEAHLGRLAAGEGQHLGGDVVIGEAAGSQSRPHLKVGHAGIFLPEFLQCRIVIAGGTFLLEIAYADEFAVFDMAADGLNHA